MAKKVGVITHWRSKDNYGQTLQIYALQCVLKDLGVEPFLIRYYTSGPQRNFKQIVFRYFRLFNPVVLFNSIFTRITRMKIDKESAFHSRGIDEFIDTHIQYTVCKYNRKQIINNPPNFDYYVTGSDQVWNKLDGTYFLDFVTNGAPRISYAASFGATDYLKHKDQMRLKRYLFNLSAVSLREYSGVNLCRQLGLNQIKLVPDPTLLHSKDFYLQMSVKPNGKNPYLLIYLLGNKNDFNLRYAYDFANSHSLNVVYIPSQGQKYISESCFPTVNEWLGLICNADYVITNSFHGTVFSLIFNRPFVSIPATGFSSKMNDRMLTLFSKLSVDHKFLSNDLNQLMSDYHWEIINEKLSSWKLEGMNFLKQNIAY